MKITAFAATILNGSDISDKLVDTDELVRSSDVIIPSVPKRSKRLQFSDQKAKFPSVYRLDEADQRGIMFHFFANHELLALELMAWALLKFPDAPETLRRDMVFIMRDEQRHLTLYLERMNALGVEFGDVPLNDFFWRLITQTRTIEEFTAAMSLTFEQANLDFAADYRQHMTHINDPESADVLRIVYEDEIKHVQHGVDWMDRWRGDVSQWQYYNEQIRYPLTPNRGKGQTFYEAPRRAAGFDDDFIQEIRRYSHSKGKTPDVYRFNLLADYRYRQETQLKQVYHIMESDLDTLPLWFAGPDDVVWTSRIPSTNFLDKLIDAGIKLPQFITDADQLNDRQLNVYQPWSWHPDDPLHGSGLKFHHAEPDIPTDWFHKSAADRMLQSIADRITDPAAPRIIQLHAQSSANSPELMTAMDQSGASKWVIKPVHTTSGNGFTFIDRHKDVTTQQQLIEKALQHHGECVLQPWLDRVYDFSYQYEIRNGSVHDLGIIEFHTTTKGRYLSNRIDELRRGLPDDLREFLYRQVEGESRILRYQRAIREALQEMLGDHQPYRRPIGIDAFVYLENSEYRLMPAVEINPRFNMGRLGLAFRKRISAQSTAIWRIRPAREVEKETGLGLVVYAEKEMRRHPLKTDAQGKWMNGWLPTSDFYQADAFLSELRITPVYETYQRS